MERESRFCIARRNGIFYNYICYSEILIRNSINRHLKFNSRILNKKVQRLESTPSIVEIFQLLNYFTGRAIEWREEEELVGSFDEGEPRFDPAASKFARDKWVSRMQAQPPILQMAVYLVNAKCIPRCRKVIATRPRRGNRWVAYTYVYPTRKNKVRKRKRNFPPSFILDVARVDGGD